MAIYHLHSSYSSRQDGDSADDELRYVLRQGHYAEGRDQCVASESGNLSPWCGDDPFALFAAADRWERANARLYQELEGALPVELDSAQCVELVRAMANAVAGTACHTRGGSTKGDPPSRGNHGTDTGT